MKSWTGKEGKEDKLIRENGETFLLAFVDKIGLQEITSEGLKTVAWEDWCNVCANNLNEAKTNYDSAFEQWKTYQNKKQVKE